MKSEELLEKVQYAVLNQMWIINFQFYCEMENF